MGCCNVVRDFYYRSFKIDLLFNKEEMTYLGLLLIVIAGIAEHFKDLSEEGKLEGYWDKQHQPMVNMNGEWYSTKYLCYNMDDAVNNFWWKVHWLQGGVWQYIPVWIRQYLSFRDGWHLLKFFSLNLSAIGIVVLFSAQWWWFFVLRFAFSTPETILRLFRK